MVFGPSAVVRGNVALRAEVYEVFPLEIRGTGLSRRALALTLQENLEKAGVTTFGGANGVALVAPSLAYHRRGRKNLKNPFRG